jgi:hypothetical protein
VEPRAVSPPRAIGTPSRHHLKCGRMDIVFIDSTSWAAYDPDTPFERPLGGTQSAVCYLGSKRRGRNMGPPPRLRVILTIADGEVTATPCVKRYRSCLDVGASPRVRFRR